MKEIMRRHLWPASLVAALAVVGLLAAFVALAGPGQRGAVVEAQALCDTASGATLQSLIQAGICQTATPGTGAGTATPGTGGPGQPGTPGAPGGTGTPATAVPTQPPDDSVCASATPSQLAALIAAGVCMAPTATPLPTSTPAPTAAPTPVPPTARPSMPDTITSSSTSTGSAVTLTLTIDSLPQDMQAGSSIVLFLEDDYDVPSSIPRDTVYFTVTEPRQAATNDGGRVYITDPVEVSDDDHFGGDDDWDIQVFLPDFNTGDDFDGFQGPQRGQKLTLVILKAGGITNPTEEGSHSVGYSVLGADEQNNDDPVNVDADIDGAPLRTYAKIGLSDEDNIRGYELTVTGSGFNNGTSAAVHVLADDDTPADLALWVNGRDLNNDGDTDDPGEKATAATKERACGLIVQNGHRAGIGTVGSDDKIAISFDVTVPVFKPGDQNFICMVDGEGRRANTDVETFKLEPSIRVSPSSVNAGDTVNVYAQDFTGREGLTCLKIASQPVHYSGRDAAGDGCVVRVDAADAPEPRIDNRVSVRADNVGTDGSATATFKLPGSISGTPLEGTVRIDAEWGDVSEDTKITVTGSTIRLSQGEARANDSVTIQGEGFGTGSNVTIDPAHITLDGVPVLVDDDSLTDSGKVDVSNAGQFVATIYLWRAGATNEASDNPALIAGTHTIRVRDSAGFFGTQSIIITEPSIAILPDTLGPRDYLTITGNDWPVDNQDSGADVGQVEVSVEVGGSRPRTYTVIPDGTGRFRVEHQVSRDVAIPSTQQVRASYGSQIVKTASFEVPEAVIEITPTEGQPGDEVTLKVERMPVYTEVDEITIGGANALGGRTFRTDRDGKLTAEGLAIPGLDPGTYSVVMKVGSGNTQTVAIGSITVLTEVVPGAVAELPGALSDLGDNLEAVFYFDNVSKEWSFYDPRDEFADLNTLDGMVADQPYWILVGEAVAEVVLNAKTRSLSCSNGDCWNLVVW